MPSDENTTQNPIPEENSIPPSSQEPTADAPIPPIDSQPVEMPSGAPEASREGFSDESNNIPPLNSTPLDSPSEQKPEEKQAGNEPRNEPVSEPVESPEPETAQMGRNEPLGEVKPEPKSQTRNPVREILAKAQQVIQNKKRKKLESILNLFAKRTNITNDEVEKFLHVSDATATRYLSILEKENKIKQVGKTGKGVSYSRI